MKNTNASGCENALGKSAFTLAELLMAVLVISIIMVALAPVITKRVHENMNVEMTKVKGEEIFSNPGDYIFEVPAGITTLYVRGAGGSGGGSGAIYSDWITNDYTYDSTTSVSYPYNWKVPKGVTQIELTITGSGGGGGAGYVKDNPEIYLSPSMSITGSNPPPAINGWYLNIPDVNLYSNKCLSDEFLATRATENGLDACITKKNINFGAWKSKLSMYPNEAYEMTNASASNEARVNYCIQTGFCYWPNGITYNGSSSDPVYPQIGRPLTGARLANSLCKAYHSKETGNFDKTYSAAYGLLTEDIARNIIKNAKDWANTGLKLCGWPSAASNGSMPSCYDTNDCPGTVPNKECSPSEVAIEGGILDMNYLGGSYDRYYEIIKTDLNSYRKAVSVRCYRPLIRSVNYNGAGGSAGAQYKKTINVLPGDILVITVGKGGTGGQIGVNSGNGSQGSRTTVTHKRGSTTMGTYYVNGAKGGKGATAYNHGAKDTSSTSSNDCYEQYRRYGNPTDAMTSMYPRCNQIRGEAGTDNTGGKGAGRLDNYKAQGGMLYNDPSRGANVTNTIEETACSNGESATPYYTDSSASTYCTGRNNKFGFGYYDGREMDMSSVAGAGGGGGYTPPWVAKYSASSRRNYAQGGKGGSGNVSLKYRVAVPGAGGGPGARLDGDTAVQNGVRETYEAIYRVKEGDKLKIKVGNGGFGGNIGQDGTDGQASIISGRSSFIFNEGKGATAARDVENINFMLKADPIDCNGGTTMPATIIEQILAGSTTPRLIRPVPGATSRGVTFPLSSYYKLAVSMPSNGFKGTPGKVAPQVSSTEAPWQCGLDGGMGGTGFAGAYNPSTENGYALGGGAIFAYHWTTGANYNTLYDYGSVAISNNPDGGSGVKTGGDRDIPTSGGGGGGVSLNGTLGKGGDGSPGYIRIRWNQAENIDW